MVAVSCILRMRVRQKVKSKIENEANHTDNISNVLT
jgi:hypothetical protein